MNSRLHNQSHDCTTWLYD